MKKQHITIIAISTILILCLTTAYFFNPLTIVFSNQLYRTNFSGDVSDWQTFVADSHGGISEITDEKSVTGGKSLKLSKTYVEYDGTNLIRLVEDIPVATKKLDKDFLTCDYDFDITHQYIVSYTFEYRCMYGVIASNGTELPECYPQVTSRLDWGAFGSTTYGDYEHLSGMVYGICHECDEMKHRRVYMDSTWAIVDNEKPLPPDMEELPTPLWSDLTEIEKSWYNRGYRIYKGSFDHYCGFKTQTSFKWHTNSFTFSITDPHLLDDNRYLTYSFFIDPIQIEKHHLGIHYFDENNRHVVDFNRLDVLADLKASFFVKNKNNGGGKYLTCTTLNALVWSDQMPKTPDGATLFAYIDESKISAKINDLGVHVKKLYVEATEYGDVMTDRGELPLEGRTILEVKTNKERYNVGDYAIVSVDIGNAIGIGSYDLKIGWDKEALNFIDAGPGDFFTENWYAQQLLSTEQNKILPHRNDIGKVSAKCYMKQQPYSTKSGNGTLIFIRFEVLKETKANILIYESKISPSPILHNMEVEDIVDHCEPQGIVYSGNNETAYNVYEMGSNVYAYTIPKDGYMFDYWVLNGVNIGDVEVLEIDMMRDQTLKAVFTPSRTNGDYSTIVHEDFSIIDLLMEHWILITILLAIVISNCVIIGYRKLKNKIR